MTAPLFATHWKPKYHRHGIYRVMCGNRILADHISADDPVEAAKHAALMASAPQLLNMLQRLYDEVMANADPWQVVAPLTLEHAAQAISEASDPFIQMRSIRVTYEDGNTIETNINGTRKEITAYYVGKYFNFGIEDDRMVKAVSVEFLDTANTEGVSA